jgi:predicted O-methyltransferase YrrM
MTFPHDDPFWRSVLDFLLARFGDHARIVAPLEFHDLLPRTFPYDVLRNLDLESMDAIVIHKGRLDQVGQRACSVMIQGGIPLFGNEVFAVFSLKGRRPWRVKGKEHFAEFYRKANLQETFIVGIAQRHSEFVNPSTVILMTTYNRPHRLAASLRTIEALKAPILVVNDGSDPQHDAAYAAIYETFDVRVLNIPGNRGLSNALNTGLGYWLADPKVEWISYLQDDVEVRSDLLAVMARVQDPEQYPLLTGRHDPLHKVYHETEINGQRVLLQRMCAGIHLHAHRGYWEKQLPIPTAYFQAPKSWPEMPLRGADEDWWIVQWSPQSIVKQGKYVCVLPGLVRTTTGLSAESTWGNPALPDPLLPPPQCPPANVGPAMFHRSLPKSSRGIGHLEPVRNFWEALASQFGQTPEDRSHMHAREERAHLFHAVDGGSTELEVLNFINALVCLFKPEVALETGTFQGFGTCAISAGLKSNGRGHLFSLEIDAARLEWARECLRQFDPSLGQMVTFINESSLEFIKNYQGTPFDFVFIDTDLGIRMREFSLLQKRGLLAPGAVCVIHDTSPYRLQETPGGGADDFQNRHMLSAVSDQFEIFQFPYSRGFHLFRHRGSQEESA